MNKNELTDIRSFLETCWSSWKKERGKSNELPVSHDMCKLTSVFLLHYLREKYPEKNWRMDGGYAQPTHLDPDVKNREKGGFFDGNAYHDHQWVTNGKIIIDLTADQFGPEFDKVIMTEEGDKHYIGNIFPYYLKEMEKNCNSSKEWFKQYNEDEILLLYHGTSQASYEYMKENGWQPDKWSSGGQCGQIRYLYLTNEPENAQWYADEKENGCVIEVKVPKSSLKVDPEDGISDTVDEELNLTHGLPGNVVLFKPIDSEHIALYQNSPSFKM